LNSLARLSDLTGTACHGCARREQARSVADVLLRRTRLGLVGARELRDGDCVEAVAAALGGELGWSGSRVSEEVVAWSGVAEAEGIDPSRVLAS